MLAWGTFTAVSYMEVKKKIDEQAASGDDVYMLKVDKPIAVPGGKSPGKRAARGARPPAQAQSSGVPELTTKEARRAAEVERMRNRLD